MAYSESEKKKIVDEVCESLSNGLPLRKLLKQQGMPDAKTFYTWLDSDKQKLQQYTRAKADFADAVFYDILNIADDNGEDTRITEDGKELTNYDNINRARLRVDARKWMLSKLNPKKYGDKLDIEQTTRKIKVTTKKADE